MNWFEIICQTAADIYYLFLSVSGSGNFPRRLTAAEETECIEQMAAGNRNARNRLIEHNLRLVAHICRKYYSPTNDPDDLLSVGTIGLIKAVDTFSPDKGTRFSSYAARCIEKATPSLRLYIMTKRKNESLFLKNGEYSKNQM